MPLSVELSTAVVAGYALALLIGVSLGLLGAGGSILTVPVFVYVFGFAPKQSIAMSLPVVGVSSLIGALSHWRAGNIHLRSAATFGVIAMGGAFLGARLAGFLAGSTQLIILGALLLGAAASMLRPIPVRERAAGEEIGMRLGVLVPIALVVGMITGLIGIGGGFLIVPALVVLGGVPMRQAVGTSLLVIAMNAAAGFAGYTGQVDIRWGTVLLFGALACIGILVGTRLSRRVPQQTLRRAFAVFLIGIGTLILFQNRDRLLGSPTTEESR